jgi:DNA-binding protein H-NS
LYEAETTSGGKHVADLSKMNRKQLQRLIADAQKALKTIETKEKREAKKAAEKAAAKFGFKLSEVIGAAPARTTFAKPQTRKKAEPKYANPADKSQTWTGMGRKPKWFIEAIEAGADPKTLEI